VCERIYDPELALPKFLIVCGTAADPAIMSGVSDADWIVGICSELLPDSPLCVDSSDRATPAAGPLATYGYHMPGHDNADIDKSLRRFEAALKVRCSNECRDLRKLYAETVEAVATHGLNAEFVRSRETFHAQWLHARAVLRKNLGPSKRLERWTDALTVPAAIASIAIPAVGALPMVTWAGAKAEKLSAERKAAATYPWLALAEQFGEVAVRLSETLEPPTA
jgi:hypothetical protein